MSSLLVMLLLAFFNFSTLAQASGLVNVRVMRDPTGAKMVKVKSTKVGTTESTVLTFTTEVVALSPELQNKYIIMSLGEIDRTETDGTNCTAFQVYQTIVDRYSDPTVAVAVEGTNCAGVVDRFLKQDFTVVYKDAKTGIGENLGAVTLKLEQ